MNNKYNYFIAGRTRNRENAYFMMQEHCLLRILMRQPDRLPFFCHPLLQKSTARDNSGAVLFFICRYLSDRGEMSYYLSLMAACAAASLAIGTRKGEQET